MSVPSIPPQSVMLCHLDDEAARKNSYDDDEIYDSLFWHILFCGPVLVPAPWLLNNKNLRRLYGYKPGGSTHLDRNAEIYQLLDRRLVIPVTHHTDAASLAAVAEGVKHGNRLEQDRMLVHVDDEEIDSRARLVGNFLCEPTPDLRPSLKRLSDALFKDGNIQSWLRSKTTDNGALQRLANLVERSTEQFHFADPAKPPIQGLRRSRVYEELKWREGGDFVNAATDVADAAYYWAFADSLNIAPAVPGPVLEVYALHQGVGGPMAFGNEHQEFVMSNVPSPSGSGTAIVTAIDRLGTLKPRQDWLDAFRERVAGRQLDVEHDTTLRLKAVELTRLVSEYLQTSGDRARRELVEVKGREVMRERLIDGAAAGVIIWKILDIAYRLPEMNRRDLLMNCGFIAAVVAVELFRHMGHQSQYTARNAVAVTKTFTLRST